MIIPMSAEQYKIQTSVFSTGSSSLQDAKRRLMVSGIMKQDGTWNKAYSFCH